MTSVYRLVVSFFFVFVVVAPLLSATAMAAETKEWTVLVFLNGHNDLDRFGAFNINQMEKVGSTDRVNVVVQWASAAAQTTKRLLVQRDNDTKNVTSAVIESLQRIDMGDYKQLVEFVKWGADHYPAKHYFVDVWNHGSGWQRDRNPVRPDISFDEFSGNQISTVQLGKALREASKALGQKIDIYGSDACLMQMLEVNAELVGAVDVVIGSQEVEPSEGWPYDTFLEKVDALPEMTSENLGRALIAAYYDFYHEHGSDVTLSAVDLNHHTDVVSALSKLVTRIATLNTTEVKALGTKIDEVQSFDYNDYSDALHMVEVFEKYAPAILSTALNAVKIALNNYVIESRFNGSLTNAKGVSIWLPKSLVEFLEFEKKYDGLSFAKTGWKTSLNALVLAREPNNSVRRPQR